MAFFAILLTGRSPRPLSDVDLGVLRWTWRVHDDGYGALGTDRYPPGGGALRSRSSLSPAGPGRSPVGSRGAPVSR